MGIQYDPGIAYRGDQYAFAGLSSLGQDVGKAIHESLDERRKQEQLQGYNDAIVNHAAQTGLITPEELNKYNAASLTQKTSMAAGYAANIHDDLQRQLTGAQTGHIQSQTDALKTLTPVQAADITSGTKARDALTPAQVADVESQTTFRTVQSLLGVQQGQKIAKGLPSATVDKMLDPKDPTKLLGWKTTQPNGTVHITTLPQGLDINSLKLLFGDSSNSSGGAPPTPTTPAAPAAAASARVTIYKNGQPVGKVPAAQAQLAQQQGYTLTP